MQPLAGERQADPAPTSGGTSRSSWLRTIVAGGVGTVLLALLVYHTGLGPIVDHLRAVGPSAPLALLPYVFIAYVDAIGWQRTLPAAVAARVPLSGFFFTRMAGEAINSITPTAAVGGEPVKVVLLRRWGVPGADAVASLVISKTALTVAQSLFVVLGMAALFLRIERPWLGAVWLVLLLVATAAFGGGLVWLQRRQPVQTLWRWLHRIAPRARFVERLRDRAAAVDERLEDFYRAEGDAFRASAAWHLAGWLIGVWEVHLMMRLVGAPIPWLDALIIEALAQPIRATAVIVPGGIGTQEVGGVALCTFLGIGEPEALTLWLLKRARETIFDAVGLLYLTRHTARGNVRAV